MVDYFALVVPHALMAFACWRLLLRSELDREETDGGVRETDVAA
jgi:hypothetical protein